MASNIEELLEQLHTEAQQIGLYMRDAVMHTSNEDLARETSMDRDKILERIKGGSDEFVLMAQFLIGDLAWTDRILNPEEHAITKEFRNIVPDRVADRREEIIKQLRDEKKKDDE